MKQNKIFNVLFWGGVFFTLFGFVQLLTEPFDEFLKTLPGWMILGIIPLGIGFYMKRRSAELSNRETKRQLNRQLLRLAKKSKGTVTVSDTSLELDIPLDNAKVLLEEFVVKGLAYPEVRDSGAVVYKFGEFLPDNQ